jgi:hypothetical protein
MPAITSLLVLKVALVPLLMFGITHAGQRWGAAVAGWLSGFPVIAGPVLLFVALDHGTAFASAATLATLANTPANIAFGLSYSWLATRLPWFACLPLAVAVFFLATHTLLLLPAALPVAMTVTACILLVAPRLFPHQHTLPLHRITTRIEIALRMLAGGMVAFAISWFAQMLGARWAGSLSVFPVLGSILAVFTHHQCGAAGAAHLLRGQAIGLTAFSAFCVTLLATLPYGVAISFSVALLAAGAVQRLSLAIIRRQVLMKHTRP